MRILILSSGSIHATLTHRLLSLSSQLQKNGHQVTILAPKLDKYSGFRKDVPSTINGVNVMYPAMFSTKNAVLNLIPYVITSALRVLFTKTDVIYIFKPTPITLTGLLGKWLKHLPVFTDMDDLGSEVMHIEGHAGLMTRLVEHSERLATAHATGLVVASTLLEQEYHERFPLKPIIRLSNGVLSEEFQVQRRAGTPHIVFFGALNRARILDPFLHALPSAIEHLGSANVIVDIIGDGISKADLEITARRLKLESNVTFHGWQTLGAMKRIVKRGDIGICIMPQERTTAACSNQKVFQYQAMELCIIATRVGDLPLYLRDGEAGFLLETNEPAAITSALIEAIRNPKGRATKARTGGELAKTTYSWETLGNHLSQFIMTHSKQARENTSGSVRV